MSQTPRAAQSALPRLLRLLPRALLFNLLALCIAFGVFWSLPRGDFYLDWGSFIASGRAAAAGLDPYGVYPLTFRPYFEHTGVVETPNLNPPISLPVFAALARLDPGRTFRAGYAIALLLYLANLGLLVRAYRPLASPLRIAWALSLAGLWHTLQLGQIYVPLLLASTGAWLLLARGRRVAAGLLIGLLVAIKPNLAIWPLLLGLAGYWATALSAGACAALLSLLPAALYGPAVYRRWLAATASFGGMLLPGNSSLPGLSARLGLPWLGYLLALLLVLALALWAWQRRPPVLAVSGLAIVAALLASPITWAGYTLLLLPVLWGRRWPPALIVAAAILAVPFELILRYFLISQWHQVAIGSLYVWALILTLLALAREAGAGGARSGPTDILET